MDSFREMALMYGTRKFNWEVDELAQLAISLKMSWELTHKMILVRTRKHPFIEERGILVDSFTTNLVVTDD